MFEVMVSSKKFVKLTHQVTCYVTRRGGKSEISRLLFKKRISNSGPGELRITYFHLKA